MRYLLYPIALLVDTLLWPFAGESAWPVLIVSGTLCACIMLGIYFLLTNKASLVQHRNSMQARALELVLFRHDLMVSTLAYGRLLRVNARYFACVLVPLVATTVVLSAILIVLTGWLEWRSLHVGESTVVDITLSKDHSIMGTDLKTLPSPELKVTSELIRIPSRNAAVFRIQAIAEGAGHVDVQVGDHVERKSIDVGRNLRRVAPDRTAVGQPDQWASLVDSHMPANSPIQRISVPFPQRQTRLGQQEISWLTIELLVICVVGLGLSWPLRIALF